MTQNIENLAASVKRRPRTYLTKEDDKALNGRLFTNEDGVWVAYPIASISRYYIYLDLYEDSEPVRLSRGAICVRGWDVDPDGVQFYSEAACPDQGIRDAYNKRGQEPHAGLLQVLVALFPNTFAPYGQASCRPLKVGIHRDIWKELPKIPQGKLRALLKAYTSSCRYQASLEVGAARYGLDGKPAGLVTEEEVNVIASVSA